MGRAVHANSPPEPPALILMHHGAFRSGGTVYAPPCSPDGLTEPHRENIFAIFNLGGGGG